MAEIITVPLSVHQQKQLQAIAADQQAVQQSFNVAVTAMIAKDVDPMTVQGWDIRLVGTDIVCTPPEAK